MPPTTGRSRSRADVDMLRPRRHSIVVAVALAVVVIVGGYVSFAIGTTSVMYSDSCDAGDRALICSSDGQLLVFLLPLVGWTVAVALGALGVVRAVRRGTGGWRPTAIGVGVLSASLALAVRIAEH